VTNSDNTTTSLITIKFIISNELRIERVGGVQTARYL
jgi:hypothetical protein